ncbi:uncharacterized protein LOC135825964 [Sycon ciliatum]|uniref:uncharacterized protein LOC135825964 n=1 Tax=Sycon ciliatum TaxID=27933 RepID=UPI0031F62D61
MPSFYLSVVQSKLEYASTAYVHCLADNARDQLLRITCQQYMLSRTTMEQTSEFGHHGRSCGARLHNVTGPSPPPLQTGDYLLSICDAAKETISCTRP